MTASRIRLIPANAYRRVRWRNGRGWTREIAAEPMLAPDPEHGWAWRLSIAEIEDAGAFSRFPGVERECMLLRGDGLRLHVDGRGDRILQPPFGRTRFSGDEVVSASLLDGRVDVLNLMWRRDSVNAASWHRPLVGSMFVFADPGSRWVIHLLSGEARIADGEATTHLAMGDTACLPADRVRTRHAIEGGGELLLVRLDPVSGDAGTAAGSSRDEPPVGLRS